MILGHLIDTLAKLPAEDNVGFSDGLYVERFHSWRGIYAELTLAPTERAEDATKTVGELLKLARAANGGWFTGYKGGDFRMDEYTTVWADRYGEYAEYGITRIDHLPKTHLAVLVRECERVEVGLMTTPSQSSVRPAGEETVQALIEVISDEVGIHRITWSSAEVAARAVIASEPWKQLEHEAVGLADRLTEARAERDQAIRERQHGVETVWQLRGEGQRLADALHQAIRERDEARAAVARVEALAGQWAGMNEATSPSGMWNEGWEAFRYGAIRDLRAALSGGAGEQDKAESLNRCNLCGSDRCFQQECAK